jgi:hypothetical protein
MSTSVSDLIKTRSVNSLRVTRRGSSDMGSSVGGDLVLLLLLIYKITITSRYFPCKAFRLLHITLASFIIYRYMTSRILGWPIKLNFICRFSSCQKLNQFTHTQKLRISFALVCWKTTGSMLGTYRWNAGNPRRLQQTVHTFHPNLRQSLRTL